MLFLTLKAPIRPMTRDAIGDVVSNRADRIGIVGKRRGPHALRHGAAQHLLDHGLSMKEVGDYLGHRSVSATAAYAKVQIDTLREGRRDRPGEPGMTLLEATDALHRLATGPRRKVYRKRMAVASVLQNMSVATSTATLSGKPTFSASLPATGR